MIVCVCKQISDKEIIRFVRQGSNFDDLQMDLGIATQCGCCSACARQLVEQNQAHGPRGLVSMEDSVASMAF